MRNRVHLVIETLRVNVGRVYLVKHPTNIPIKAALKEAEVRLR